MKFKIIALSVATVASYSHVVGLPSLVKRIVGDSIGCFVTALAGVPFDDACKAAVAFDIGVVQSVEIKSISFDLTTNPPTIASDNLSVNLIKIPGVTYDITEASGSITITDNGVDFASFTAGTSPVTITGTNAVTKIAQSPFMIDAAKTDAVAAFVDAVLTKPSHTTTISGSLSGKVRSIVSVVPQLGDALGGLGGIVDTVTKALPLVSVSGIGFRSSVTLNGFSNFPSVTFVSIISVVKDINGFTLTWKANIVNPSQISIKLGTLVFETVNAAGKIVGKSTIADFTLVPGDKNELTIVTVSTDATILDNLSVNGDTWSSHSSPEINPIPYIAKGLTNIQLNVKIPALGA
ncbi:hypothetical protein FBU30_004444 [Linnemannia zychae]|nr:hypothetical protein FBU30_004444 [Linnemannia zychae]